MSNKYLPSTNTTPNMNLHNLVRILDQNKVEGPRKPSQTLASSFTGLNISPEQGSSSQDWRVPSSSHASNFFSSGIMPPRRKRRFPPADDSKAKKSRKTTSVPTTYTDLTDTSYQSVFSSKRCLAWFEEYKETDDTLGPEGMEKFCEDIGLEPENIVMLIIAWKLEAYQMGFFTLQEWMKGMSLLQVDSVRKLQAKFDYLRSLLNDPPTFKKIYRFAFDFAREKDKRGLDYEIARTMLRLLLGRQWVLYNSFQQFLDQTNCKVVNKDQWCNILEFSRTIQPDLSNYDEDGAWPVMLDEFVEWLRTQYS